MTVIEETRVVTRRDVLHRAADLLGEWDWYQGGWCPGGDLASARSFCAAGALARAEADLLGGSPDDCIASSLQRAALVALGMAPDVGVGDTYLAWWNDAEGRTKAEVVARLRAAAEADA